MLDLELKHYLIDSVTVGKLPYDLNNLPKIMQVKSCRAGIQTQICDPRALATVSIFSPDL